MPGSHLDLVIDCDPGHDDAVAILLAHKHAHLHAITTVSGNAPVDFVTNNAITLLDMMDTNIPIYVGAEKPLVGNPLHAAHVHGEGGFGGVQTTPSKRTAEAKPATAALSALSEKVENLWVVAIGPLTNIALTMELDSGFAQRVAGISFMGGSTQNGNATPAAEFNILADPEAAQVVMQSGANLKMCGLNLTQQIKTNDKFIHSLQNRGEIAALVADLYSYMHDRLETIVGERRASLHDPCAVLALTHPHLIDFKPYPVQVETQGQFTRGMTLVDQRATLSKAPANVDVALSIAADEAMALVTEAILSYN